ncbi:MAG TPA: leucyl aminopeptidase [Acidimicrobiales bacterium]|nr:leucyl aminopeptidase [Acidimicrobiales bacterium]
MTLATGPVFRAVGAVPAEAGLVAVPATPPAGRRTGTAAGGPVVDPASLAALGFEDRPGQTQIVPGPDGRPVLAVGLGERTAEDFRRAGAAVTAAAWHVERVATTVVAAAPPALGPAAAARALVEGMALAAYRYGALKRDARPCRIQSVDVVVARGSRGLQRDLDRASLVAGAACWARDLVNEPAGTLTPARLAELAAEMGERAGLAVEVLDEAALADQRMGALLGVGQGSVQPPRLIRLAYEPARPPVATVALVGKGITFDSGGLSLKPADSMMAMKTDMSGAAAVLATMSVLPALAPAVRVAALVPAAENMPGGRSLKPGDVVRARNGTTIEVLNTDAEGRLVLADALALAAEAGPDAIVDLATLTGAQKVALGTRVAGLMGNHDGLVARVRNAAERAGEPAWPLPLPAVYRSQLDSPVADLKNIGDAGIAGALVAGLFLQEFVAGVPWAHLDIAGPARSEADDAYLTKGGTGWGVRTLAELLCTFEPLEPR